MWSFLLLAADAKMIQRTWFLFPLVVVVSLVYSASRYEASDQILRRAFRLFLTILGFMGVVFALLFVLSYGL